MNGQEREALEAAQKARAGIHLSSLPTPYQAFEEGWTAALAAREEPPKDQLQVVVDFLDAWRYCPVSSSDNSSRECLEDAAGQLLAALVAAREEPQGDERAVQAAAEALKGIYPNEFADNFYFYGQAKAIIDAFLRAREDTERPDGHKLKLTIEDGSVYAELIHPDGQSDCDPPTTCACGRSYGDEETERCYDCPEEGDVVPNCWLDGHEDLAECLVEKVETVVDVVAHWDGECPVLHVREPEQEPER